MNKGRILLLGLLVVAVFGLLIFSSWTNALVVQEQDISPGLGILSSISPLLIGIFIVLALAVLIVISSSH